MGERRVAHHDLPRVGRRKVLFILFRYGLYATLGIALEVMLYSLARAGRQVPVLELFFQFEWQVDPDLNLDGPWHSPLEVMFGQSSLWMIPVYVLPAFAIEELYRHVVVRWPWWLRAPLYGLVIMAFELVTGLLLVEITGYAIWMYVDAGNVLEMTTFYIWPIWMIAGLLIERIYRELMDLSLRQTLQVKLDQPPAPRRSRR